MNAHGIDWAHAWPYVVTGYVVAVGPGGGYAPRVVRKLRRAEHALPTASDEER